MSMPERNGDWMLRTSAEDDAPQRTASRKALSWSGGSNPVGSGRATFSMSRAPGSNSQTTWISSPSPSSSTDASETRVWGSEIPCRPLVGSVLGTTSLTIQFRDRTLTSCPCSGALIERWTFPRSPKRRRWGRLSVLVLTFRSRHSTMSEGTIQALTSGSFDPLLSTDRVIFHKCFCSLGSPPHRVSSCSVFKRESRAVSISTRSR